MPLRGKKDLNLNFIRNADLYYNSEIHQCPECKTFWEYFPAEADDNPQGWKPVTEKSLKQYGLI